MTENKVWLDYIYEQIDAIKPVNFIFVEYNKESYLSIEKMTLPKVLKEKEQEVVQYFGDKIVNGKRGRGYVYKSSFEMRYLGIELYEDEWYRGHIILGPYLSSEYIGDERVFQILEDHQVELAQRRKLIEVYKCMPMLRVVEEKAIMNMISGLWHIRENPVQYVAPSGEEQSKLPRKAYEVELYDVERALIKRHNEAEQKVVYYIRQGDEQRAMQALGGLNRSLVTGKKDQAIALKNLILTLNGVIKGGIDKENIDIEKAYYTAGQIAINIEECKSVGEQQIFLKEMIRTYCKLINEAKNPGYSALISKATQYIRFNFEEEINLKKLAQEFFVHPSHLSRKFREETGCQISEYINRIRIEQAGLLLNDTEMSITDIAFAVGYNDEKYFSKIFKKIHQKTPREHRSS